MDLLKRLPSTETFGVLPDFVLACYSFYGALGFDWHWDRYDLVFATLIAIRLIPKLWRDGRELHYAHFIRPRELVSRAEYAARQHRRRLAQSHQYGGYRGR